MAKTPTEKLLDALLSHAKGVERFAESEGARIVELLDTRALRDLEGLVLQRMRGMAKGQAFTLRQMTDLRVALSNRIGGVMRYANSNLAASMQRFATVDAKFALKALKMAVPGRALEKPTVRALRLASSRHPILGSTMDGWFGRLSASTQFNVAAEIRKGIAFGESVDEIAARVERVLDVTRAQAKTIALTSVKHVSAQTQREVWLANSDIVDREMFTAVLDDRTTEICADHDGEVYKTGDGPYPPLHWRCRSRRMPMVKGDRVPSKEAVREAAFPTTVDVS